jgi:DNA-binding GntR family transcriptional regulator
MTDKPSLSEKPVVALTPRAGGRRKRLPQGLRKSGIKPLPSRDGKLHAAAPTKTNLVYSDLRGRILRGELEFGTRIVIRRIAEQHKVSDIPVREALRLLEKDHLIRYFPYGSAFVRGASDDEIYEVLFIRGLLEGIATQLSVSFMTDMTLQKLTRLCEEMERCARAQDVKKYAVLNHEFHRAIFDTLPFTRLIDRIEDLWQFYTWSQLAFHFQKDRMAQSNVEHRQIVDALRQGSMNMAGRAAFEHKQSARKALIAARKRRIGLKDETPEKVDSIVEGIELLCDIWAEAQWPLPSRSVAKHEPTQIVGSRAKNSKRRKK